jgi:hypothetical protein
MTGTIQLNSKTIKLLNEYFVLIQKVPFFSELLSSSVSLEQLIQWLIIELPAEKTMGPHLQDTLEFTLSALQAALLEDLDNSIANPLWKAPKKEVIPTTANKLKFAILSVSGIILAVSEGIDSITTMAEILPVSAFVIFTIGMVFSALSIMAFCGLDLPQAANNLGINRDSEPKLLDNLVLQMKEIKKICNKLSYLHLAELSIEELQNLKDLITALQMRISSIAKASKQFSDALDALGIKVAKTIIAICSAGLFFGTGYFAGQSVALYVFSFFISSVTTTFWPVIAFSIVVGLSGFALNWYIQKVGLDKLVSSWMGLDEEKIDKIANLSALQAQVDKLENLKLQIHSTTLLLAQINSLRTTSDSIKPQQKPKISMNETTEIDSQRKRSVSSNIFTFHNANAVKRDSDDRVVDPPELDCCAM